ncbi:MAG: class II fructose-bisphosphate aldolase [Clostridiales bacterium]|jgi:fructose-bisphosphate aldolase class II|nr:class II fructose-bisphosphate aldolase [Clostridiales bacterium]
MLVPIQEMLADASKRRYGLGMFDAINQEMVDGIIAAAEAERAPVILATVKAFGNLLSMADSMLYAIKKASVPIALEVDHGTMEACFQGLAAGYNFVMYDGSMLPFDENAANTRIIAEAAHAVGAGVEAELGHVANAEVTYENANQEDKENIYTDPEEAVKFVEMTGVDCLAVSVGTLHGRYKSAPDLQFDLIRDLKQALNLPLVIHGSSGITDEDVKKAVAAGVCKMNFFTDLADAAARRIAAVPDIAALGFNKLMSAARDAVKDCTIDKIRLLGASGKA